MPQILKELNARNVLFKGRAFNSGHVYKILSNERYSGKYTVHGETYTNTFPKIVSDEIFDRVAQTAKKNLRCKRSVSHFVIIYEKQKINTQILYYKPIKTFTHGKQCYRT